MRRATLRAKTAKFEARIEQQVEAKIERFEAKIERFEAKIEQQVEAKIEQFKARAEQLKAKTGQLKARTEQFEARIEQQFEAKIEQFKAKTEQFEAKIERFEAKIEQFKAKTEDELRFIRSWLESPLRTGAVSPSGRFLARAMARLVDPWLDGPVIELGPGTGVVTQALADRGIAQGRLVLVEFNRDFIPLLRKRFPRARVVCGDAYATRRLLENLLEAPASAVVSSLPLMTQPVERRVALLDDCFALMRPEGSFVQFSYMINPPIPVEAVGCRISGTPRIWWNLPPARVWCYHPMPQRV